MAASSTHFDREDIDVALVERLISAQFPQWADLPISPAVPQGWDNKTFRLGAEMSVRLPSAAPYALQVEKERRWLPELAPHLPLPIPVPLAKGAPAEGYPFTWCVYRWLEGETASTERVDDLTEFATTLADFLAALQRIDPAGGPPPGRHNFFRGGPLTVYDAETQRAIAALDGKIDTDAASAVWEAALAATWHGRPVWIHGDVTASNLLVVDGRLSAVIDWGGLNVGDPACDLQPAWNVFEGASRARYRAELAVDDASWLRGRGWALAQAVWALPYYWDTNPGIVRQASHALAQVLGEA